MLPIVLRWRLPWRWLGLGALLALVCTGWAYQRSRHRLQAIWRTYRAFAMDAALAVAVMLALAWALSGCASAPKAEGVQITVTTEEAKRCENVDCALISQAELANIKYAAYMLGQKEAFGSDAFDSQGCKKGDV